MKRGDDPKQTPPQFTPLTELVPAKKHVSFALDNEVSNGNRNISWKQCVLLVIITFISFSLPSQMFRVQDPKALTLLRSIMNSVICAAVLSKKIPITIAFN